MAENQKEDVDLLIKQRNEESVQACLKEVQESLEKHKCSLVVSSLDQFDGRWLPKISVVRR